MAIRINQNLFSLLVNKNLNKVSDRLEGVYQRLSSGQRIVKAGDDPAGLAVSHGLKHEIRGLQQNIRNANDAMSVTSTAESALNEVTNMLQHMRELSLQAANSTLTPQNREAIQTEIRQVIEEIDRVANSTEFNGRFLLNGESPSARIQIGTEGAQYITVSLPDIRASLLGKLADVTGASAVSLAPIAGGGDLTINGVSIPATTDDGLSATLPLSSAIAKANAINSVKGQTGVEARAMPTVLDVAGASISAVTLDGFSSWLTINGQSIGPVTVQAGDADGALRQAINRLSGMTGVTATLGSSGELTLTAADGRNITVSTSGSVADELGLATSDGDLTGFTQTGQIALTSGSTITVGGAPALIGFGAGQTVTNPDPASALIFTQITDEATAQDALRTIDEALHQILGKRADLGAIQNRIESGVRSLSQRIEELSASNARILDADIAYESAQLAQLQILQEAGTAVLAQANVAPRAALNLLNR